jgi:hypothetical protein
VLQENRAPAGRAACATHRDQAASPPDRHDWRRMSIENVELKLNMLQVYRAARAGGKGSL